MEIYCQGRMSQLDIYTTVLGPCDIYAGSPLFLRFPPPPPPHFSLSLSVVSRKDMQKRRRSDSESFGHVTWRTVRGKAADTAFAADGGKLPLQWSSDSVVRYICAEMSSRCTSVRHLHPYNSV